MPMMCGENLLQALWKCAYSLTVMPHHEAMSDAELFSS